jgi:hypothetical protein
MRHAATYPTAKVIALSRVGGLHHRYEWREAARPSKAACSGILETGIDDLSRIRSANGRAFAIPTLGTPMPKLS